MATYPLTFNYIIATAKDKNGNHFPINEKAQHANSMTICKKLQKHYHMVNSHNGVIEITVSGLGKTFSEPTFRDVPPTVVEILTLLLNSK